jgi:hypothetical protein
MSAILHGNSADQHTRMQNLPPSTPGVYVENSDAAEIMKQQFLILQPTCSMRANVLYSKISVTERNHYAR